MKTLYENVAKATENQDVEFRRCSAEITRVTMDEKLAQLLKDAADIIQRINEHANKKAAEGAN